MFLKSLMSSNSCKRLSQWSVLW